MSDDRNILEKGVDKAKEIGHDIKEGAKNLVNKTDNSAHRAEHELDRGGAQIRNEANYAGHRVEHQLDQRTDTNRADIIDRGEVVESFNDNRHYHPGTRRFV